MPNKKLAIIGCMLLTFLSAIRVAPASADESLSLSGKLDLQGVEALDSNSVRESHDFEGRIKMDAGKSAWRFHSWLEGGWDGTVKRPPRDHSLFKNYDEVYQSNSPYLEFKELYVTHSSDALDLRAGIQRFAWGRLDEYPPNDLLNPWDYTRFLRKPLEDRKIGVPSLSASFNRGDWTVDAAWIPVFVPYRLPLPDERWAGTSAASQLTQMLPNAEVVPREPDLPDRTIGNSSTGLRIKRSGDIEWALNLFHGIDPRSVFRSTSFTITPGTGTFLIDPGYVPDFHRITSAGIDAATVKGDWSLRMEVAYTFGRRFNIRRELWGYPASPASGVVCPLPEIERKSDSLDYGIGADYRLIEDVFLLLQAQQTVIFGRDNAFFERKVETVLWASLKAGWMNDKIETKAGIAWNPEHGDEMVQANAWYIFTDSWKAGVSAIMLNGPPQSLFGNYSRNDQVEADLAYSW